VTDQPGDHPLPHPQLASQTPLIHTVKQGEVLYRHHRAGKDPVYFGTSGDSRFDDPDCPAGHTFGVLYAGENPQCCFIESCGSTTGVPAVSGAYLDARAMATLELTEDLRFVDLFTTGGLTRIGADGRLFHGFVHDRTAMVTSIARPSVETRWNPLPIPPRPYARRVCDLFAARFFVQGRKHWFSNGALQ
jgi:hypothetical protein